MNTVSELTMLWNTDKNSLSESKNEYNFRIHAFVEDRRESFLECKNEYSFRIDGVVEDRRISQNPRMNTVSKLMLWKTEKSLPE